jgi:hypothetical protein
MGSNITISMRAKNNDSVILYHNGLAVLRAEGDSADFKVNNIVPAGLHRFVAEAKNTDGLASADSIRLNILPPVLEIVTNVVGRQAKVGDDITVNVNVSQADSIILFHNNVAVIRKYGNSIRYIINSISGEGVHVFTAKAKSRYYGEQESGVEITVQGESATDVGRDLQSKVKVYPNPFSTEVRVESDVPIASVDLIKSNGEMMRSLVFPQVQGVAIINTSALPSGSYFIRIVTGKGIVVRQVVKK